MSNEMNEWERERLDMQANERKIKQNKKKKNQRRQTTTAEKK